MYYLPVCNGVRTIPKGRTSSNHPRLQVSISGWLPHVPAALLRVDVKLSDQRVGSQLTKSTIPEATNPPLDVREQLPLCLCFCDTEKGLSREVSLQFRLASLDESSIPRAGRSVHAPYLFPLLTIIIIINKFSFDEVKGNDNNNSTTWGGLEWELGRDCPATTRMDDTGCVGSYCSLNYVHFTSREVFSDSSADAILSPRSRTDLRHSLGRPLPSANNAACATPTSAPTRIVFETRMA
ncbi:hypothetical protein NEUTE2DRAFT_56303 [Neurospora tetrasperma FGSC 2509]|nr:hypothetical protein NEUTE2DRAFT_56303 [Neurospora tetrasperma FGSC 2509]